MKTPDLSAPEKQDRSLGLLERARRSASRRRGSSSWSAHRQHDVRWREAQGRATWGMSIGLAAALFVMLLLKHHPVGQKFEFDSLDVWFNLRDATTSQRVALAAIDEETVRSWKGRAFDGRDMALALRRLKQAGAASVSLVMPSLCGSRASGGMALMPQDVAALTPALRGTGFVMLPLLARTQPGSLPSALLSSAEAARWSLAMPPSLSPRDFPTVRSVEGPPEAWMREAAGAGHTSFGLDTDGRPRVAWPSLQWRGRVFPSLAMATARRASGQDKAWADELVEAGQPLLLDFSPLDFPMPLSQAKPAPGATAAPGATPASAASSPDTGGMLDDAPLSDEAAEAAAERSVRGFPRVSVARLLGRDGAAQAQVLAGKHVIVCVTAQGMTPAYFAPDGRRVIEGELHAVALDNLLSGSMLVAAPEIVNWVLAILSCVVVGGFVAARHTLWSAIVTLLCLLTIFVLSAGLFAQNVWLDITPPWLGIGLTYLTGVIGRARRDTREATRYASTVDVLSRSEGLLAAQTSAQELLGRILDWSLSSVDAERAWAMLLDENGQSLSFAAAAGPGTESLLPFRLQRGEGVEGWVLQNSESLFTNDAPSDARFKADDGTAAGLATRALACVPFRANGSILGVLCVANRRGNRAWRQADIELLEAIAAQSALALDNARLYEILNLRVQSSEESLEDANRRLETERNLLSTVLHSMTDGVIVIDAEEHVRMVNRAASKLLPELNKSQGRSLSQVLAEYPGGFVRLPQDRRGGRSALFTRGDPDAPRFIEARSSPLPLRGNKNAERGEVLVFADVTEEKHIEQAKSDFVSFVAHEMRSPLTTISGFSSMMRRTEGAQSEPNPQRLRFLGLIHDESERLKRLINSLLDVSRIESGHSIELSVDDWEFSPVASRAIDSQRVYSSRHHIESDWPQSLPPVHADRDKTTQILINLLSNAMKYSPGGAVTVAASLAADGQHLQVGVRDEGPGIAPEQQARLFERFGRLSNPVGTGERAKPSGTGLGLFLSKHLVELQGGRMWVQSAPGAGTTFFFTLPLAAQEEAPQVLAEAQ